tara:strand:- start:465 stop:1094 length:630 start_codon:yes stop_codon:yes gene_type:complete
MTPESIFTIIFIIVVLSILFGCGLGLWRAISKRKEIENLFSEAKYISGRVIGYTERKYDSENTRHHYAIVEYLSDQSEVVWAETQSCNKGDYSINSEVNLMYHAHNKRDVMVVLIQDTLKMQLSFERNLELFINVIFTTLILVSVIYYGYGTHILIFLLLSYSAGFAFGAITKNKSKLEEKLRIQYSKDRNKRLIPAQEKGETPCYLKE